MNLLLALAPAVLLMIWFYQQDRLEPEPRQKVLKVMLWGGLCVVPAIWWEQTFGPGRVPRTEAGLLTYSFLMVALPEEICKLLAVMASIYRDPEFDEPMDGIVYAVAASLGFAAVENVIYVVGLGQSAGLIRALLTVPCHAFYGVAMGYQLGTTRFLGAATRARGVLVGLGAATLMHGLYDPLCFSPRYKVQLLVFPLTLVYASLALVLVRRLQ